MSNYTDGPQLEIRIGEGTTETMGLHESTQGHRTEQQGTVPILSSMEHRHSRKTEEQANEVCSLPHLDLLCDTQGTTFNPVRWRSLLSYSVNANELESFLFSKVS